MEASTTSLFAENVCTDDAANVLECRHASRSPAAAAIMEYQEVNIPMPWGHIAGKWWGLMDKAPILAIHGWQDNAGSFDEVAPHLVTAGMSVLCIDLPGHGYSSQYPVGMYYNLFWDGLQIVHRIKTIYDWPKLRLLGHSLGGIISFIYASAFPDEVDCFICIDIASPTVRNPVTLIDQLGSIVERFLKYETFSKDLQLCYKYDEMVQAALIGYGGSCTKKAIEILLKRGIRPVSEHKYVFTRDLRLKAAGLGMIGIVESLAMAQRITCRVLNIRANPGLELSNPEYYDMVLDEMQKTATLERHVVNGTHHLHLNDAVSVAPIIVNFLLAEK